MPATALEHEAGLTWLGTENLGGLVGMPPGQTSQFSGSCTNDSGAPIHIFSFWPHMHTLGRHMRSTVTGSGGEDVVFDRPFDFNQQVAYDAEVVLMPGDVITSTCTFDNVTDRAVPWGPSTDQEMCYQFAFSYPAGALDNGVPSLNGSMNTCW